MMDATWSYFLFAIIPVLEYNSTSKSGDKVETAYISAKEAAVKWGISQRRVAVLCSENRILNATMVGNMWIIPETASKPEDARFSEANNKPIKPFLKWVGGKTQLLPEIRKFYPFGSKITKYAEPFVGGGAVLFDILGSIDLQEVYISDQNSELINSYKVIRDNVGGLLSILRQKQNEYLVLDSEGRKKHFYAQRDDFNKLKHAPSDDNRVLRAALMIYLNKTCFNGLYRVNRKGDYNVPMGAYKQPLICDAENLRFLSKKLQKVKIHQADYREVDAFADEKTFVYFDPPYRPLTKTANFTSYTENDFDDNAQLDLARFIKALSNRGCKVLASNSDPKNANKDDNFFDDAYSGLNIRRVQASRMINSKGPSRGKISELLISNY